MEEFTFTISPMWDVLKQFKIVRGPRSILKWGFWQVVTMNIVEMMYNPGFTGIHSSPKERQLPKCCVSFEKECNRNANLKNDVLIEMHMWHTSTSYIYFICSDWEDWREDTDPAVCLFCDNSDSAEEIISHLKVLFSKSQNIFVQTLVWYLQSSHDSSTICT